MSFLLVLAKNFIKSKAATGEESSIFWMIILLIIELGIIPLSIILIVTIAVAFSTPTIEVDTFEDKYQPVLEELEMKTRTLRDGVVYADDGIKLSPIKLIAIFTVMHAHDYEIANQGQIQNIADMFYESEVKIIPEYVQATCDDYDDEGNWIGSYDCSYWIDVEWTFFYERPLNIVLDELFSMRMITKDNISDITNIVEIELNSGYAHSYTPEKVAYNGWVWPTPSTRITSQFGNRNNPITNKNEWHTGVDIGAVQAGVYGDPIWSIEDGIVKYAGWLRGYGITIIIEHSSGIESKYAHLDKIQVNLRSKVTKGQEIGNMGNTGTSTGVHLHFEIISNNQSVNPMLYY